MRSTRLDTDAIVLGSGVNGIAVIRSLGRLGARVVAIHVPLPGDHATWSRYVSFNHPVSQDATDIDLTAALREVTRRLRRSTLPVVIPTTDRFSEFLSRNSNQLSTEFQLCCAEETLCDAFLDKWKTAELCAKYGILIPQTACPASTEEVDLLAATITFPVVVKPRYTFGTSFPGKNAVVSDGHSLRNFFASTGLAGHCVVQQIIPSGDGDILVTASYSGVDATVKALYSGRKLRQYLPDYGATCFGISERHPELESETRRFLNSIGYKGFAALEFARSREDGRCYFLELNTRTYYHNQLFADAGVDLTQIGYLSRSNQDASQLLDTLRQRDKVVWLDFRRDFQSMRIKRKQSRITILGWILSLFASRSFAYWNWRDPVPFFVACVWRSGEALRNLSRRITLTKRHA